MAHKIALLSDIHGNTTALEAVIKDSIAEKATEYWLLGDFLMPGPGTRDLLDLLRNLPVTAQVKGNWDDCFLEAIRHEIDLEDPSDIYIARLSQYVAERLRKEEISFINDLPLHLVREVEGLAFGISHNLPDKNWGGALVPSGKQENFDQLFAGNACDVAVYGHVHHQSLRYSSEGQIIINPGTVGQPFSAWGGLCQDLRAQYALIELDKTGIADIKFRKVAYDVEKEIRGARDMGLPYANLYQESLETGIVHTHDTEMLKKINQENHYDTEVRNFFKL